MKSGHKSKRAIFALPLLLALLSIGGLIAGLLGDGWEDVVAWFGLGIPTATIAWAWSRRQVRR